MPSRRRGTTMTELAVALVVLSTLMSLAVEGVVLNTAQRRALERRAFAIQAARQTMTELTALRWNELTPEKMAAWPLADSWSSLLPAARLSVTADDVIDETLAGKQITVDLSWTDNAGNSAAPVHLTAWVYKTADKEEEQ